MEVEILFQKMEKIKMPIRIAILAGTIVLFVGLFTYLVYLPKTEQIRKTEEEINKLEGQLARAKIKTKDYKSLQNKKKDVDQQLKEALRLLPNEKEIPNLLRKVTELGNESNLDFRFFDPKNEIPKDFYIEIPVAIEVRGNYHDVAVFFDKIGRMDRIMNIHNVRIVPIKAQSSDLIVKFDAVTYRFKEN
jgi:type IV pilus assembly protein PilO